MIVAVTGHRPDKIGGYEDNPTSTSVRSWLFRMVDQIRPTSAICGMALGVDQLFADVCIELKIPFVAAVPFVGQHMSWPQQSQDRYIALLAQAVDIQLISEEYTQWCMQKRNEWMVDSCDLLLAVWDGSPGGTGNCVRYAKKHKWAKDIVIVDPREI